MQLSLSIAVPGHVTSHALKELILKYKVVIIYLNAIFTEYKPKPKVGHCTAVNENLNLQ
jgi:hypothetical protein